MKYRLAVVAILGSGMLLGGAGTASAVSGVSSSGSAGAAQYPESKPPVTTPLVPAGGTAPGTAQSPGAPAVQPEGSVLGESPVTSAPAESPSTGENPSAVAPAQVQRQVESGATAAPGNLPFTGFVAI